MRFSFTVFAYKYFLLKAQIKPRMGQSAKLTRRLSVVQLSLTEMQLKQQIESKEKIHQ